MNSPNHPAPLKAGIAPKTEKQDADLLVK